MKLEIELLYRITEMAKELANKNLPEIKRELVNWNLSNKEFKTKGEKIKGEIKDNE